MSIRVFCAAIAVLVLVFAPDSVQAEKRVALVIGNSTYAHAPAVRNAEKDARLVADMLHVMGFSDVLLKLDLAGDDLRDALDSFAGTASRANLVLIYFAGYGLSYQGENYLLPIDAKISDPGDVELDGISQSSFLASMERTLKTKIVILDAARGNPFGSAPGGAKTQGPEAGGLVPFNPQKGGTLVAHSAGGGTVAVEGQGDVSPYAAALIKHMTTEKLEIRQLFERVRDEVVEATGGSQIPVMFGFLEGKSVSLAREVNRSYEGTFWDNIKDSRDPSVLRSYLKSFPQGEYASIARTRLKAIQGDSGTEPGGKRPGGSSGQLAKVGSTSPVLVGRFADWTLYHYDTAKGKSCYMFSSPKSSSSSRKKKAYFMVRSQVEPTGKSVFHEVSVQADAPFRKNSQVSVRVGGGRYAFFTRDNDAWIRSLAKEAALVGEMRTGSSLTTEATFRRGTKVTDSYSLNGFDVALRRLDEVCPAIN